MSKANGNWSDIGELKRRFTWNHSGAYLHDVYWANMGRDDISKGADIKEAIEQNFGSVDAWKTEFKACAVAAKLSGWGLLVCDKLYSGRLINVLVDEHQYGAIWGGIAYCMRCFLNTHTIIKTVPAEQSILITF
jgi:Fe-Mn family superoxide dismutase